MIQDALLIFLKIYCFVVKRWYFDFVLKLCHFTLKKEYTLVFLVNFRFCFYSHKKIQRIIISVVGNEVDVSGLKIYI